MPFERQGAGREPEPERADPVELRGAPVMRVLALQQAAGNRAVTQLIAGAAIQRQPAPPAPAPPAAAAPPGSQGPASAPNPQMRAVLPIASIPQLVAARATIEALQPGAQATVALGPSGVPVDHADRAQALSAIRHALMEGLSRNLATRAPPASPRPRWSRSRATTSRRCAAPPRASASSTPTRRCATRSPGALGLEEVDRAVAEAGAHNQAGPDPTNPARNLPNAEARARAGGRLAGDADWCGAFAQSMQRQSGANPDLAPFMHGTEGIISLLTYRAHHWIQVGGAWDTVEHFHDQVRHSRRFWREIDPASAQHNPRDFDMRPGDLVLLDLARGTRPDHIAMIRSFDPATGIARDRRRQRGLAAPRQRVGTRNIAENPRAVEHPRARRLTELMRLEAAAQRRRRALTDAERTELAELRPLVEAWDARNKPSRVFGWGRLSLVDYETHYAYVACTAPSRASAAPTPT